MIPFLIFTLCTCFFTKISWKALRNRKSHGFYRFFAFEGILLLVLLNQPQWLQAPTSLQALLSWGVLLCSLYFICTSLFHLKKRGGQSNRQDMPENFSFENTVNIVETGLYGYVRHPMYSSLLFLAWGAFLKQITPLTFLLVILTTGFLIVTAKVEEKENIEFFGKAYRHYMTKTKMFIPKTF